MIKGIAKLKRFSLFMIILTLLFTFPIFSQESENREDENPMETPASLKNVFFDLGYGARGVSFGAGVRWWNVSAGIGLAGILTSLPKYSFYDQRTGEVNPMDPKYNYAFNVEKFPSTTVSIDFSYYYDYNDFSFFVTLGYFVQSDSVLKKFTGLPNDQSKNVFIGNYYPYGSQNSTGLSWGFGSQYILSESINVALAFHNKKGIFAQIGYYWH